MCLLALGRLAREGFVVAPEDAMDLIHDFLIEEEPNLSRVFDPQQGSAAGLAYAAFLRFARPWIIEEERWRRSLVDPTVLESRQRSEDDPTSESTQLSGSLGRQLEAELSLLPERARAILFLYFSASRPSERLIARRLKLSRREVRDKLLRALSAIAARLERPEAIPPGDWTILRGVWIDGMTIEEVASTFAISLPEARASLRRCNASFSQALGRSRT